MVATRPRLSHDRRLAHIESLLDDIELAQSTVLSFKIGESFDLNPMLIADILDVTEPVVRKPHPVSAECREHPSTSIVSAHDNMFHFQNIDRELNGRQTVKVRMYDDVRNISMDEHLPRQKSHDLVCRHPTVGAPDPEILRSLLSGETGEERWVLSD